MWFASLQCKTTGKNCPSGPMKFRSRLEVMPFTFPITGCEEKRQGLHIQSGVSKGTEICALIIWSLDQWIHLQKSKRFTNSSSGQWCSRRIWKTPKSISPLFIRLKKSRSQNLSSGTGGMFLKIFVYPAGEEKFERSPYRTLTVIFSFLPLNSQATFASVTLHFFWTDLEALVFLVFGSCKLLLCLLSVRSTWRQTAATWRSFPTVTTHAWRRASILSLEPSWTTESSSWRLQTCGGPGVQLVST